jgi:endonuclease/exonuclease/phosphatase family metal-dependent hydrolase
MNALFFRIILCSFFSLFLLGCSSSKEVKKEEPPSPVKQPVVPEDTIHVASLNLAKLSRRIENDDIAQLAKILKRESIHILALEAVTRYPELTTRLDIVDELRAKTEMYSGFGETINLSGKQTGNAVLSVYPIRSTQSTLYEGLQSKSFASAFQAIVDCGVRDVVIVSTHLPEKASDADQMMCVNTLISLGSFYSNRPMIIAGNLPTSFNFRKVNDFKSVVSKESSESLFWFLNDGSLKFVSQKTEKCSLGTLFIAQFGIFRLPQP